MPLITRRSSTRGFPGLPCRRWGSNAAQASSDNQNKCVIAASLSVGLNEGRDSPKYSTCCMSSQPRACTHKQLRNVDITICARKSGADLSQSVLIADDRQVPHRGGEKCS